MYTCNGFGTRLFNLRKNEGLSRKALANALKCGEEMIHRWEFGIVHPQCASLCKIANYFGVSIDELLSDDSAVDETDDGCLDFSVVGGNVSPE